MKQDIQNIVEGNKLIHEFMEHGYMSVRVQYDKDWAALMPVVEKIESLGHSTTISSDVRDTITDRHCCEILEHDRISTNILHRYGKTKIESVWLAITAFIQWYNNQQKQVKE